MIPSWLWTAFALFVFARQVTSRIVETDTPNLHHLDRPPSPPIAAPNSSALVPVQFAEIRPGTSPNPRLSKRTWNFWFDWVGPFESADFDCEYYPEYDANVCVGAGRHFCFPFNTVDPLHPTCIAGQDCCSAKQCYSTSQMQCCGNPKEESSWACSLGQSCGSTQGQCIDPPGVVPEVGTFRSRGCFFDDVSSRTLQNGSSEDFSSSGMTVEKCVELAKGWRYAGVEYSGQCYWGDDILNDPSHADDCHTTCAGNSSEICGDTNRINIYQDFSWWNPTRKELADLLRVLEDLVVQIQNAIKAWQDAIDQYVPDPTARKREVRMDDVLAFRNDVLALRDRYNQQRVVVETLFTSGRVHENVMDPETSSEIELLNVVDGAFEEVASSAATSPVTWRASAQAAAVAIGAPAAGTIAALGAFVLLAWLIGALDPPSGGGSPTSPTVTTTSVPTPSTTTYCNACVSLQTVASLAARLAAGEPELSFEPTTVDDDATINATTHWLSKRAGREYSNTLIGTYGGSFHRSQPRISFCENEPATIFWWRAKKYPSTTHETEDDGLDDSTDDPSAAIPSSAPQFPNIGRFDEGPYVDVKLYIQNLGEDYWMCDTDIHGFANNLHGSDSPGWFQLTGEPANSPNEYHTEHVFELHMIKDFFHFVNQHGQVDCTLLRNVFGPPDMDTDSNADVIMGKLAWYDPAFPDQGFPGELFVLQKDLNLMKGAIMNGRPLTEVEVQVPNQVYPRPNTFQDAFKYLQQAKSAMQFLSRYEVGLAFRNARDRVWEFLTDDESFLEINEFPEVWTEKNYTWGAVWDVWLGLWLDKRQKDLRSWRLEMRQVIVNDPNTPLCWQNAMNEVFDQKWFPEDVFAFPADFSIIDRTAGQVQ